MAQIKIIVNGKECFGEAGKTILAIAAENGIEIPNLCYNKQLKVYGACGLCVVEVERYPSCCVLAQLSQPTAWSLPPILPALSRLVRSLWSC